MQANNETIAAVVPLPAAPNEWLSAEEAARYLKIKPRTLLLWARQQKIKGYTLSGTHRRVWRFRRVDLDAMLTGPSVALESRRVQ